VADLDEVVARRRLDLAPLLVGRGGRDHLAERLLLHPGEEALGDVELDVGLEERDADVAQGVIDVRLASSALPVSLCFAARNPLVTASSMGNVSFGCGRGVIT